jgi:CHAT domain-containing protein
MEKRLVPAIVAFFAVLFAFRSAVAAPADFLKQLQEADRRAWLTDWYSALPIYAEVEKNAAASGDQRDATYAKFGRLRGRMQTMSLADASEQIATDLETPLARRDTRLRLRGLTVKGDIDLEWNVQAAKRDWQQVKQLAAELGEKGWENRSNGELGMIAFLMGNTGEATTLVRGALETATQTGDIGGQLRYMGAVANGLLLAGYAPLAMGYVDRALAFSNEHPEAGFPFVVYSTKVQALITTGQLDEAERFATTAIAAARAGDRRIKEVELSMMQAQIADKRGQREQAATHLQNAIALAKAGHVQRLLADAEEGLAQAYRARGDLARAHEYALAAVRDTELTGSRFTLPIRLGILADVEAAQGRLVDAERVYARAADVVEGIMVNVPSRDAQARLVGVMSDLYAGYFRLVAGRLKNPLKAYQVIERARGRALADVLRTVGDTSSNAGAAEPELQSISRLQVRLIKASSPAERKQILDALWEAEQHLTLERTSSRAAPRWMRNGESLQSVQQQLRPSDVLVEYVLGEPESYALTITDAAGNLVMLPSKRSIEASASRFVTALKDRTANLASSRNDLSDAIVRPVGALSSARRVFVVPDGRLHLVPFDVLFDASGNDPPVSTTIPSAGVLALLRSKVVNITPQRPLLAIGGVPYDRMFATPAALTAARRSVDDAGLFDASYPPKVPVLTFSEREVLAAAGLLGPNSVVLTGDRASESTLKAQDLSAFDVLHFAVHAFADAKFPERAALVLLNDPAAGEDGLLQPREIARFRLNASVVVLSACDTSVGPTIGQEGVLNLARAFLLAGARSVVTTLWTVSDATSTALMQRFYQNLTAGQDVAESLARSKAATLKEFGADALPTVAAFQLVGPGDHRIAQPVQGTRISGRR